MTLNQIVKLATDAGFENANEPGFWISDGFYLTAIEMFAALVAAHEREACAKLAGPHLGGQIAAAIRARGE